MDNQEIYYDSWKENRDIILEYNQVSLKDATISNILGLGVDNVTSKQAIVKVMKMIEDGGVHHVMALNPYKMVRYKANQDLNIIFNKASLKFASGAGVVRLSRISGAQPLTERIPFLSFLMELIRLAEIKEYSIFLVGAKPEIAEKAYSNLIKSFPKLRVVGRHGGFFNPEREKSVVEAIRKTQANIVLIGMGFPKEDKWIAKIRNSFQNAVLIGIGGSIDIISGENMKAPAFFMERGLDWFYRCINRPWRYGRLFRVWLLFMYGHFFRIFLKGKAKAYRYR